MKKCRSAASQGLLSCHVCSLISRPAPGNADWSCPRCAAHLHFRKPDSIKRTWALLIAGYALYIPANLLPVMETSSLIDSQIDTIFSGVVYLWTTGSWLLSSIVFIASIVVPLVKLLTLSLLLISVQRRSTWCPFRRTQMYRAVDLIGRWSMLDVFVSGILVALVQIPSLAIIKIGSGMLAFGALVVMTMLASINFDPRLIWDSANNDA
ncbi:MAG: paraquat-inducible protein A [Pseudomonadota bacterium]